MGCEASIDALAFCEVASNVLATEAVSHGSDFGNVVSSAYRLERSVDDGFDVCEGMALLPLWEAVVGGRVRECIGRDRVTAEQVRHDDEIACFGDAVGEAVGCQSDQRL